MTETTIAPNPFLLAGRWLIGVFGAVLAASVTAFSLNLTADPRYPLIAIAAGVLAFACCGLVVWHATRLLRSGMTLEELRKLQGLAEASARGDVPADPSARWAYAAEHGGGVLEHLWSNGLPAPIKLHAELQADPTDGLRATLAMMLDAAARWQASSRYRTLMRTSYLTMPVILACVPVAAWALLPDESRPAAPSESRPAAVDVMITNPTPELNQLATCGGSGVGETVRAIAIGGTWDEPLVVTVPRRDCPTQAFIVTDDIGIAVPAEDEASSSSTTD